MMKRFYIKKLIVSGAGKETTHIEFSNGLTIISGPSNTGETCIMRSIAYCFGDNDLPFDESFGYTQVQLLVETEDGIFTVSRKIKDSHLFVSSQSSKIGSGEYTASSQGTKKLNSISSFWLSRIGVDKPVTIFKNKRFVKQKMSWLLLKPLYYVDENSITKAESVILPEQKTAVTAFLSALLFLISGKSATSEEEKDTEEVKEARRQGVLDYVHTNLDKVKQRIDELSSFLLEYSDIDLDTKLKGILYESDAVERDLDTAIATSKTIFMKISDADNALAEGAVLSSRYQNMKRFTFLTQGKGVFDESERLSKCPFCDSALSEDHIQTHQMDIEAELSKIVAQLDDLEKAIASLDNDNRDQLKQRDSLQDQYDSLKSKIQRTIKPKLMNLRKQADDVKKLIELRKEHAILINFQRDWGDDLAQWTQGIEEKEIEYRVREHFSSDFVYTMGELSSQLLSEANYRNFKSATFDLSKFDLDVNGFSKSTFQGKGFRAFINAPLTITIRQYLYEHGMFSQGLLMIDTPLLGFDETGHEAPDEGMKRGLFTYLLNHQEEGQTIVIENAEHTPNLDYNKLGAQHIQFTKQEGNGRYGFLPDVRS